MSDTPSVPPIVNRLMTRVLRSPVHKLVSKNFLLITFTGRKSGKTYTTPVSYSQEGDQVSIFTHANWWKNLRGGTPVTLRLRGREVQGMAEATAKDKQAVAAGLTAHLKKMPGDARFYDVTFDDQGNPRSEEVEKAVQTVVMIQVRLHTEPQLSAVSR
jgi:deazaflavin-dependent oxidoreductase (nitroreductase family)